MYYPVCRCCKKDFSPGIEGCAACVSFRKSLDYRTMDNSPAAIFDDIISGASAAVKTIRQKMVDNPSKLTGEEIDRLAKLSTVLEKAQSGKTKAKKYDKDNKKGQTTEQKMGAILDFLESLPVRKREDFRKRQLERLGI